MKNHQFAFVPTNFQQQLRELQAIHFIEKDNWKQQTPLELFQNLLFKTMANQTTISDKKEALNQLLANAQSNGAQLQAFPALTSTVFYNIALQLLGWLVDEDFKIDHPIEMMKKTKLPFLNSPDTKWDTQELLKAWYLLLNTRSQNGQPYLDRLASQGYYRQFKAIKKPLLFNGKAQPVFNTDQLIRDVVYVEAPLDTDEDGQRDLLKVFITRPSETETGTKVPTIFTSSPYNQGVNEKDGEKMTHDVNVPLKHKHPGKETINEVQHPGLKIPKPRKIKGTQKQASEHFEDDWTYTLNDYFLARGFAVAYASGIGTKGSDGLRYLSDEFETISTTSVIDWLAGNRTAFTNHTDQIAIKAWWSNQNVGMTGRSYLGTLQMAAAATGVKGLKACIPEAGISSWYDYYRENGLVMAPGGFQGEDADVLAEETFSRQQTAGDYWPIKNKWHQRLSAITQGQDRDSGNYNQFWHNGNYLPGAKNVHAALLLVQGLNDWNVKPRNVSQLWQALKASPAHHKLVLHQGEHIYINNFQSIDFSEMANLWMTHYLLKADNHANEVLPNVTIQDNANEQTWTGYDKWNETKLQKYFFNAKGQITPNYDDSSQLSYQDALTLNQLKHYTKVFNDYHEWTHDMFTGSETLSGQQLIFKTAPFEKDTYIDGEVQVNFKIKSDHDVGLISAFLVDYGQAKRLTISPQTIGLDAIQSGYHWRKDNLKEFKFQSQTTPFKKISEGHMNMQNRHSNDRVDELKADQFYKCQFKFQPTFYHLPAGRQLGIVIMGTDLTTTIRDLTPIKYTIDLSGSDIEIPFKSTLPNNFQKW